MNTYRTGLIAEFWARMLVRLHGFRILESRYTTGRNTGRAEIDIIARRRNLIVFIEVKHRPDETAAICAITPAQSIRLRRAAETYLGRIRWTGDARFDAIIVCGHRIKWVRGII